MYALRLTDEILARVDAHMEREGIRSKSEAIRQLLDEALTAAERRTRRRQAR
jgi:metal-responsive CopG/Arc/MetJ family transcriptional regulator